MGRGRTGVGGSSNDGAKPLGRRPLSSAWDGSIEGRVERGGLHRVHRGLYCVGRIVCWGFDREMAAAPARGTRALVSDVVAAGPCWR